MSEITLSQISNFVCKDINLRIRKGEILVLLGPSGAGKTTLLNVIAGLIPYSGTVCINGNRIDDLTPSQRDVGYLFQDLSLFPHLNVKSNIAYGLKVQKALHRERRVDELLRLMKIGHLAERYPRDLSGGERQRVALARAIAPAPRVLLLDEPLSSLDLRTARYLMMEIRSIQRSLGITTLYVTHSFVEAREMADRVGVIHEGRLEQIGSPSEVFIYPVNERIADFIGPPNVLYCKGSRVLGRGLVEVNCGGNKIIVPHEGGKVKKIAISPRHVYVSLEKPPGPEVNRFRGVVDEVMVSDLVSRCKIKIGDAVLVAEVPQTLYEEMNVSKGREVFLVLKLKWISVIES
ncbi:MAG: ABC transporter ATP-binding protein [Deltaproteobacteria bacterium]|nr:ABC transporter ATP-binding protein [Deltaproteobacteria bacterium]